MDKNLNSWTVVQFINDETVEAGPSSWIQGDLCHWPPFSQAKLIASIRHCDLLNTCWPTHKVKVFRNGTFDDYIQARNKAKLAEETSDLNTEENGNSKKIQRKRKQIIYSSSEDEPLDEISYLPTPPKIKNKRANVMHPETENNLQLAKTSMQNKEPQIQPAIDYSSQTVSQDSHCLKCHENDKNFKILTQQNHILRGLVTDTLTEVKDIKKILAHRTLPLEKSSAKNSFFKNPGVSFPVNTDEDFDQMETVLQNEEIFQNAVIELSKLGGSCEYDLVKRVLSRILTNDHTLKYSWLGRKGKKPFCDLNISKLLIGVLEHSGISKSRKDSENAIQTWLRRASDRKTRLLKKF